MLSSVLPVEKINENNGALLERDCVSENTIAKEISQSKQRCVLED